MRLISANICLLISMLINCHYAFAIGMLPIDNNEVIVCPVNSNDNTVPDFTGASCSTINTYEINPQNKAIWIKASLTVPIETLDTRVPYAVYVSGKTSSRIYFNGEQLGENGTPSLLAADEYPGKMDAMFYLPQSLIKTSNEVVLQLSSHHGFIELKYPIHFIGIGPYSDPRFFVKRNIWVSIIPLGALIIGAIYFAVCCISPYQRRVNALIFIMSALAACELIIESARALYAYSYPLHDIRLLLIVGLSLGFGLCFLSYIAIKLQSKRRLRWVVASGLVTLVAVFFSGDFDLKTAMAILVPTTSAALLTAIHAFKTKAQEQCLQLLALCLLAITIFLSLRTFHGILFYYITSGVLCFLFVQQARALSKEQTKRKQQQHQVAKLQFKLEQNDQKKAPHRLKVTSAGKLQVISSDTIVFCKASGDYVELHLHQQNQTLYSGTLKELEQQLPPTFIRVHRSYLVNMNFIQALNSDSRTSSGGTLLLESGEQIPVSRRIMPMVREAVHGSV